MWDFQQPFKFPKRSGNPAKDGITARFKPSAWLRDCRDFELPDAVSSRPLSIFIRKSLTGNILFNKNSSCHFMFVDIRAFQSNVHMRSGNNMHTQVWKKSSRTKGFEHVWTYAM
jgi:hypothetical protein